MKSDHYCVVLTTKAFNARFRLAWACPVTTGLQDAARGHSAISLMGTGLKISGIVLCHEIKSLDWASRKARLADRLQGPVLDQILETCTAIIDPERR